VGHSLATGGALMFFSGIGTFFSTSANWHGSSGIPQRVWEHLQYSGIALVIAAVIGLPLGLLIGHTGRGGFVVTVANSLRALPTFGLLVFFVVLISPHIHGKGDAAYLIPNEIVLSFLAIPGILANTYAGVQNVDPEARDAARGMGMRGLQVLRRVEFPCALPLIISGIRNATLQIIATATVSAEVGLGGLGRYVIDGLAQHNYFTEMAPGAVLIAALALLVDFAWALVQHFVVSPGISGRYGKVAKSGAGRGGPATPIRGERVAAAQAEVASV
jgi:osmoprotectant transport system permease protein